MLFFVLLVINLIFISLVTYITYPLFKTVPERPIPEAYEQLETNVAPFYIYATKENISTTINSFFEDSDEQFTILLDDYVSFSTEIPVFGMDVLLQTKFEPSVEQNGNLILTQHSISLGVIQIPNEYALQYIANTIDLPDWVFVRPKEELIYIDVNNADFKGDFHVQFDRFDLAQNEIILQVYAN